MEEGIGRGRDGKGERMGFCVGLCSCSDPSVWLFVITWDSLHRIDREGEWQK